MNITVVHLNPLTREVKRLADAAERQSRILELLLTHLTGMRLDKPAPVDDSPEVTYSDDFTTAVREAEDEAIRLGFKAPRKTVEDV